MPRKRCVRAGYPVLSARKRSCLRLSDVRIVVRRSCRSAGSQGASDLHGQSLISNSDSPVLGPGLEPGHLCRYGIHSPARLPVPLSHRHRSAAVTSRMPKPQKAAPKLRDGDRCTVVNGTHAGKSGTVRDINTSKTGHVTITVVQANGVRFKTLARNVEVSHGKSRPRAKS